MKEKCPYVEEKSGFGLKTFDKSTDLLLVKIKQISKCQIIFTTDWHSDFITA